MKEDALELNIPWAYLLISVGLFAGTSCHQFSDNVLLILFIEHSNDKTQ